MSGPAGGGPGLAVSLGLWQDREPLEAVATPGHADGLGYDELWVEEMATFDAFALASALGCCMRSIPFCVGPLATAVRDPMMVAVVGYLPALGYGEMFAAAGFGDLVAFARERPHPRELLARVPLELVESVGAVGSAAAAAARIAAYRLAGAR